MSDSAEWDRLLEEYQRVQIGTLWITLVLSVCKNIVHRYRIEVFNNGLQWDDSSISDLAHDVILNRLLAGGQIEYIVGSARNSNSARGLVGSHVKQVLAQRAAPTQRDNVAGRLFELFAQNGEPITTGDGTGYRPPGSDWRPLEPPDSAISKAARIISELPRLPNRGTDRLSPLFTTEALEGCLGDLWDAVSCPITLNLLRRILTRALTGLEPALFQLDGQSDELSMDGLSAEEDVLVRELADQLIEILTAEQREILVNIEHLTDAKLAAVLGVSRPTALKRRHLTRDAISGFFNQPGFEDLSADMKGAVLLRAQNLLGGAPA
jgi:hypothetical protein